MPFAIPAPAERRDFARSEVSREVKLHLPAAVRGGYLVDLSRSGAQIEVSPPPPPGTPVMMRWDEWEAFGEVVWVRGETCGVRFDRLLPAEAVDTTAQRPRVKAGPTASVANIRVGERRSSRLLSNSTTD